MMSAAAVMNICAENCTEEMIIRFKRGCGAIISYKLVVKRFERYGFIEKGAYAKTKFQNLEEQVFGLRSTNARASLLTENGVSELLETFGPAP